MALPFYILNQRTPKAPETRKFFEHFSEYELRKNTGLQMMQLAKVFDWLEEPMQPVKWTNNAISAETKILAVLGFFRSGGFQWLLGTSNGISQSSFSRTLDQTCNIIIESVTNSIKMPQEVEELNTTKARFYGNGQIPNIVGCVDGTHVEIIAPHDDKPVYIIQHQKHSINCQVVANYDYSVNDFIAKWPGSTHDSFIWRQSSLIQRFEIGEFGDSILLGDSGYSNETHLRTSARNPITNVEVDYNNRFSRTRTLVERLIGIWKSRFRCMHKSGGSLWYSPSKTCKIIMASACWHIFYIKYNFPILQEDEEEVQRLEAQNGYN